MVSGSTGPGEVVAVVVVVVVVPGAGEVAAFEVEAWTSKRLSLLDGPVGSGAVGGLVLVSASGAREAAGLVAGAGTGALVCAEIAVRAVKSAAPAQRKMLRRVGIDDVS